MWITITPSEMTSHFSPAPHLKATSTWLFYAHQFQYVQYFSHHLPHKTVSSFQLLVMKLPTYSGEKSWNHLLTLSSPSSSMYLVVASLEMPCLSSHWSHCSLSSLSLYAWITPRSFWPGISSTSKLPYYLLILGTLPKWLLPKVCSFLSPYLFSWYFLLQCN